MVFQTVEASHRAHAAAAAAAFVQMAENQYSALDDNFMK